MKKKTLQRAKQERNILHTIKKSKAILIGHTLHRNCILQHNIKGHMEEEVSETQGSRRKLLLDDFKEIKGCCKLKEEALDSTVWRTGLKRLWTCRETLRME